ncbi:flagellar filament capping protein FliD [Konateibacter massiliensis]|uniref:flagellar filament capping protein FliD n=1 Tax=Konateibacter massiliensis TaxID=2002841 RepID=UPI0015D4746F|nr:flagellar filament capping protein FliD [Konateibacter massiliensis]
MLYDFYNYYSNSNTNKSVSRYDAHKKSELKSLYSAIVRLNRESPLYLINMNDELQNNLIDIKEHARTLKNAISAISENEDDVTSRMFNDKILTSSNEEIISAHYLGSQEDIESAPVFDVEVEQLASNQINTGDFVYSDSSSMFAGTHSFQVNIANMNYEFQFIVKDTDTNKDILKRVSGMINRADIGVSASIEFNESGDKSRIILKSTATGSNDLNNAIFRISDYHSEHLSGSVEYYGLNQVSQPPNDSKFYINEIPRTSSSNIFTVNKVYELSLHQTTNSGENVRISFQNNKQSTYDKISAFTEAYNQFIDLAKDTSSSTKKSSKLLADIGNIANCYKNELDSMGLIVQEDSSIMVDHDLLVKTIDEEEAGDGTFASLRSFRNPLNRKIDNILLNPVEYVSKTIVSYPNIPQAHVNAYAVSLYSGLMFNNYC